MVRQLQLGFCACLFLVPLIAACGGDSDAQTGTNDPGVSPSAAPSSAPTNNSEPDVKGPASKYTLLLSDVGEGYFTDRQHTFTLDIDNYAGTAAFTNPSEGRKLLKQWGYVEGFETAYEPEGRQTDVLNGKYYINVETHLFETSKGAAEAYAHFENVIRSAGRAEQVETAPLGNQYSAWKTDADKISGSSVIGTFHRFILRRGNMVAVVQTWGAQPFMRVDIVRGLAAILDDKALGRKDAPEPTPLATTAP